MDKLGTTEDNMDKTKSTKDKIDSTESIKDNATKENSSSTVVQQVDNSSVNLKRQIGVLNGISVICGLVIGSGIWVSPGGVLEYGQAPGVALIMWVATGLVATLGALTFIELGLMFPAAGEKYVYLEKMFGEFIAFLYLWMYQCMLRPGSNAIKCLLFGRYVCQLWFNGCEEPIEATLLVAFLMAATLTFLNCYDVTASTRGQTTFFLLNVCSLLAIGLTGFVWLYMGRSVLTMETVFDADLGPKDIALGMYAGIYAYGGWNALNFMLEETKNPTRTLPIALVLSMIVITTLYFLVNLAYMIVLTPQEIIESPAVAVTFGTATYGSYSWVITLFIAISAVGSFNSGLMCGSRLTFAGARNGHLPPILAAVSINSTSPVLSLILQFLLICCMIAVGDIKVILTNMVVCLASFDFLNVTGLLYMRWKKPHLNRPIKIPIVVPLIFWTCMVLLLLVPAVTAPETVGTGLLYILLTGTPVYLLGVKWTKKPKAIMRTYHWFHCLLQKILMCVPTTHHNTQ